MPSFNPFSSNATINTRRNSVRSDRPPTYTSTYTSNATAAPTYTSNEQGSSSARYRSERVRARSGSIHGALSEGSQDSDTVFDQPESSLSDTVSITETSAEMARPPGPRYIYYRTYAEDGPIPTKNPVYSDDQYLGRIPARLITPPHNGLNLKHSLSGAEGIDENINTNLFISASSQTPMDDSGRVSILAYPGPGCTPHEPMALVAVLPIPSEAVPQAQENLPPREGTTPIETRYIYYQIYGKRGAVQSRQPADSNDPYVGCISTDSTPPPHTATSIMRCIAKIEEPDNTRQSQLFTSISSESPIEGHVSILTSDRPGSTPEDPMAFVQLRPPALDTLYPRWMRANRVTSHEDPNWLATNVDEILYATNEGPYMQPWNYNGNVHYYSAYRAINNAGQVGFVYEDCVTPC